MLKDRFNRQINYLRFSITSKCNLSCIYCNNSPIEQDTREILKKKEIFLILKSAKQLNIQKLRITGGEPLLRDDLIDILEYAKELGFAQVSLTTNATLLNHEYLKKLKTKVDKLNIPLASLSREKYKKITQADRFESVFRMIKKAKDMGFDVKINVVLLRGINDDEILDFINFSKEIPVRFIELMPTPSNNHQKYFLPIKEVEKRLKDNNHNIQLIAPISNPFCSVCNKIRINSKGKVYACLTSKRPVSIKKYITESIIEALQKAAQRKPKKFRLTEINMRQKGG